MDQMLGAIGYGNFIIVLCGLIFIHELGHYLVARACGVRVEVFSIGFGREIIGYTDRFGTRWKLSLVPLGGYVKMMGEMMPLDKDAHTSSSMAEQQYAFHFKPLWKRSLIVLAGPVANFLYAILVMTAIFVTQGLPNPAPFMQYGIGSVAPESAADRAGMQKGDIIIAIDDESVADFSDIVRIIGASDGELSEFRLVRQGEEITLFVALEKVLDQNDVLQGYRLGITAPVAYEAMALPGAIIQAVQSTVAICGQILQQLAAIFIGAVDLDGLGGPVKIAQLSNDVGKAGVLAFLSFTILLSINLGLLNLLPIPMLDGGHLLFYIIEGITRRPVSQRIQAAAMRTGMLVLLSLMVLVTINDILGL
ncbi:MAG: RIP metalloprotease RseP [Pseudomonadota bacterium]